MPIEAGRFSTTTLRLQLQAIEILETLADRVLQPLSPNAETTAEANEALQNARRVANKFILRHWDISSENVLVNEATGRPTCLLDFDMVYADSLATMPRYPPIMAVYEEDEIDAHTAFPDDVPGYNDPSIRKEFLRARQCMCVAFDARLNAVNSPWRATQPSVASASGEYTRQRDAGDALAPVRMLVRMISEAIHSVVEVRWFEGELDTAYRAQGPSTPAYGPGPRPLSNMQRKSI
ncbi:hypothetical protein B0T26DRAFT_707030 [Lasiosphaeria miniovina]|uniref:Uncharacterized protein n=1 Tax=Lasiosphaeria miniovina TaxID=1954250 RepID=A0AA40DV61_9PEZI|nr:uncharacterized protein B0T26DRAFT_707030 [Lasiosphaeria miniovina]KAK0716750.1 hypothetical protein B0T26DRAFT_707030 [Lasiosphaeria miniovina]